MFELLGIAYGLFLTGLVISHEPLIQFLKRIFFRFDHRGSSIRLYNQTDKEIAFLPKSIRMEY